MKLDEHQIRADERYRQKDRAGWDQLCNVLNTDEETIHFWSCVKSFHRDGTFTLTNGQRVTREALLQSWREYRRRA